MYASFWQEILLRKTLHIREIGKTRIRHTSYVRVTVNFPLIHYAMVTFGFDLVIVQWTYKVWRIGVCAISLS